MSNSKSHHSSHSHSHKHRHKSRNKYKNLISYFISVFTAICVLLIFWGVTIKTGLLNADIMRNSLNSTVYYEEKVASLTDNLKKMFADSGIGEDGCLRY